MNLTTDNITFVPDVLSYNDYYPYGMIVPNRNYQSPEYRYGFQGQEKDDEVKGSGSSINYRFRIHDPRVGRFFAIDPLTSKYAHYTPYSFSGNKVIAFKELEGMEEENSVSYSPAIPYKKVFTEDAGSTLQRVDNAVANLFSFVCNNTLIAGVNGLKSVENFTYNNATGEYNNVTAYDLDNAISGVLKSEADYFSKTPIKKQFSDLGNDLTTLEKYDVPAQIIIGHKLPKVSRKKNIPISDGAPKLTVLDEITPATSSGKPILILTLINMPGKFNSVRQAVSSIPASLKKKFMCDKFANSLIEGLKKSNMSGVKIRVQNTFADNIISKKHGIIGTNGFHEAVKVGNKVYDNMNPNGVNYNDLDIPLNHSKGAQFISEESF